MLGFLSRGFSSSTPPQPQPDFTLAQNSITGVSGDPAAKIAITFSGGGKVSDLAVSSDNDLYATASFDGDNVSIDFVSPGSAVITVSGYSKTETINITINGSFTLQQTSINGTVGDPNASIGVDFSPGGTVSDLTLTSDDSGIATATKGGITIDVHFIGAGSTNINVAGWGETETISVVVNAPTPSSIEDSEEFGIEKMLSTKFEDAKFSNKKNKKLENNLIKE
ncbi:MAG: hypothetical protein FWE18_00120 [Alphaproteobacteria bacterium]|nr:hypothetical protein [Alphaproteobacteria bacterium]